MRQLSGDALTKLARKTGNEPVAIVEITWHAGTTISYADKELPGIKAAIIQLSDLDEVIKLDIGSTTANISMTLDDTDGEIKALMDQFDIHKAPVIVKQYFTGLALSDAFELFRGEIYSPIVWDEGDRTVSFEVVSKIYEIEAGFAPEEGQFAEIPLELTGKAWPMGFGTPMHVPATKNSQVISATAMSIGGIPDATLPLKREILDWRIAQATVASEQYQQYIRLARQIEIPSAQLQTEYANFIIAKDQLRQTIEDLSIGLDNLNSQIEKLLEMMGDPSDPTAQSQVRADILALRATRNDQIDVLRNLGEQLSTFEKLDDIYGSRIDNAKFVVNFVNRLRQKCRKLLNDIFAFQRELTVVNQAINDQATRATSTMAVSNGNRFDQNTQLITLVNNVTLSGAFANNLFTIGAPQPSYAGIAIGPRQSDELDTFWLQDDSINLTNMYIKFDGKYVTKVLRQEGNKCVIQLPKKLNNAKLRRRYMDYSSDKLTKDTFDSALGRLLTGVETPDQVAEIAATIPRDINPKIMNLLKGSGDYFYIEVKRSNSKSATELHVDLSESNFTLKYGEYDVTSTINFLVSDVPLIPDIIISSTTLLPAGCLRAEVIDQVTQDSDDYWTKLKITHTGLLPSEFRLASYKLQVGEFKKSDDLVLYYPDVQGDTVRITLDYAGLRPTKYDDVVFVNADYYTARDAFFADPDIDIDDYPDFNDYHGYIDIYICGKKRTYPINLGITGAGIVNDLVTDGIALPGDITGTGDLDTDGYIQFTYNVPMRTIYVDTQNCLTASYFDAADQADTRWVVTSDLNAELILGRPKLVVQHNGSAHEYTREEIRKKIENAAQRSPASAGLKKFRDKIDELLKLRKQQQKGGNIDAGIEAALNKLQGVLTDFAKRSKAPETTIEEVHKIISNEEFSRLYDLEVNGYLEFVSEARPLDITFDEAEAYEFVAEDITIIEEASPIIMPSWMSKIAGISDQYERIRYIEALPRSTQAFYINVGDLIHLADAFQEQYVCNIIQSEIHAVFAERTSMGLKRLVPVPSSYYTVVDRDYGGYICTVLQLARPLKWFDPSWEENLYVTYTSTEGPNVCGIIRWLVAKYTTIEVDNTSFDHVQDLLSNYPANFALTDKRDCLQLIEDIAWQSRCQVWVTRGKMYIRYLPEIPTTYKTISETDIIEKSLRLTFTNTEELITKFTALWRPNYFVKEPYKMVVRRNVSKYKEIKDERDFFIFNDQTLVYKALTFWTIRRGNSWRRVMFKLFLNHLDLETQDIITLDLSQTHITDSAIKALVETANYNSDNKTIDITCWLPVLAHQKEEYQWAWPMDQTVDILYPPPEDITEGYSGNPINIDVPSGVDYDPYDPSLFDQRPKDIGYPYMGDVNDDLPANPAGELTQIDYNLMDAADTTLSDDSDADDDGELDVDFALKHSRAKPGDSTFNGIFTGIVTELYEDSEILDASDIVGGVDYIDIRFLRILVVLPDGKQVVAYPMDYTIDGDTIRALIGSRVMCFYDTGRNEYVFNTGKVSPIYLPSDFEP